MPKADSTINIVNQNMVSKFYDDKNKKKNDVPKMVEFAVIKKGIEQVLLPEEEEEASVVDIENEQQEDLPL